MWFWWLQGSTMGFMLFHLQHYAHVPDIYYDIPRNQHERDFASLIGDFLTPL
jgi:omega-6 fatty acid desaturase (delta-12 desaturase)